MDTVDKEILKMILLEEEEDDEILSWYLSEEKRKQHDPLFTKRSTELSRNANKRWQTRSR